MMASHRRLICSVIATRVINSDEAIPRCIDMPNGRVFNALVGMGAGEPNPERFSYPHLQS
jgi:hypothetical protein